MAIWLTRQAEQERCPTSAGATGVLAGTDGIEPVLMLLGGLVKMDLIGIRSQTPGSSDRWHPGPSVQCPGWVGSEEVTATLPRDTKIQPSLP